MRSSLTVLIPSYRRPESLFPLVSDCVKQVIDHDLLDSISVLVVDDCSPNIDLDALMTELRSQVDASLLGKVVNLRQNSFNKGMSRNIFDMVRSVETDFFTIVTDDDKLQPGALNRITQLLEETTSTLGLHHFGLLFPRFSYLEDGSLHAVTCKPFRSDRILSPSSVSAIRFCRHGFILTGAVFSVAAIDFQLWKDNIENAYFPVIYTGATLSKVPVRFCSENLFQHTVLNKCHWDRWGSSEREIRSRLAHDFHEALTVIANESRKSSGQLQRRVITGIETREHFRELVLSDATFAETRQLLLNLNRSRFTSVFLSLLLAPSRLSQRLYYGLRRRLRELERNGS